MGEKGVWRVGWLVGGSWGWCKQGLEMENEGGGLRVGGGGAHPLNERNIGRAAARLKEVGELKAL